MQCGREGGDGLHPADQALGAEKNDAVRLYQMQAVWLFAVSPKSRALDNGYWVFNEGPCERREVPEFAYDMHTKEGREQKHWFKHWWAVGSVVENEAFPDPYLAEAKVIIRHRQHRPLPWEK